MKQSIIITTRRKPKTSVRGGSGKGPINLATASKRPARRRLPKGGIWIYDTGLIWNDSAQDYVENPFTFNYSPYYLLEETGQGDNGIMTRMSPSLSDYETFTDQILAVPVQNLASKFKKLSYDEVWRYGLCFQDLDNFNLYYVARIGDKTTGGHIVEDNSILTEDGIRLDQLSSRYRLMANGMFPTISFGRLPNESGTTTRVTREPNYNAEAVPNFRLPSNAEVFIIPKMHTISAGHPYVDESTPGYLSRGIITPLRSYDLYKEVTDNSSKVMPLSLMNNLDVTYDVSSPMYSEYVLLQRELLRQLNIPSVSHFQLSYVSLGPGGHSSRLDPTSFSSIVLNQSFDRQPVTVGETSSGRTWAIPPQGGLLAIVVGGGSTFYIWADDFLNTGWGAVSGPPPYYQDQSHRFVDLTANGFSITPPF